MLRAGELVCPRQEQTNWLFSTQWSALKTHIQVTSYRLNWLYFLAWEYNICICMCMDAATINEKLGHIFQKDLGGINGRTYRE